MEKSQCKKICILVASLPPCWMKLEAICTYDTLAKLPKCTYEKPSLAQNRLLEFWKNFEFKREGGGAEKGRTKNSEH